MRLVMVAIAAVLIAGCGIETVGTAATGAQIKKQELEEAKKTQQRAQQKIEQATQQMQERAQKSDDTDAR
ncbi:MAG: hypothetical protein HYX46_07300 [Betaproteobacteria bacterium]|nr:hypothetical protein [Betaproteobacteria bacterium]